MASTKYESLLKNPSALAVDSEGNLENEIFTTAIKYIQENEPFDYKALVSNERYGEIEEAMRAIIKEELELELQLVGKEDNEMLIVKQHLSPERVELISKAFTVETYKMQKDEREEDVYHVTRIGEEFHPSIKLNTVGNIQLAIDLQAVSILVESILLVLSIVGVPVHIRNMNKIVKATGKILRNSSAVQIAIARLVRKWIGANALGKATLIFNTLKDTFTAGLLWKIIKLICADMTWFEWLRAAATITATLIAAFISGGAAFIAKIVLSLDSAVSLVQKIVNYNAFLVMSEK